MAYSASANGQLGWGPWPVTPPVLMDPFAPAVTIARNYRDDPDTAYQDFHAWQFTPAGLRLILIELLEIGMIDWRIEDLSGPETFEFFVTLRRSGDVPPRTDPAALQAQRRDLLLLQLAEAREQIDFILGSPAAEPPQRHSAEAEAASAYEALNEKIAEQDARLKEMAETLAWLRAVLSPIRTIWRTLRRADAP